MKLKHAVLGGLALIASSATYAASFDAGAFTMTWDDTTTFGNPTPTPGAGTFTLIWTNPDAAAVTLPGAVTLPNLTVTANAGFHLNGPLQISIGDAGFQDVEGSTTSLTLDGAVGLDGNGATMSGVALTKTATAFNFSADLGIPVSFIYNTLVVQGNLTATQTGSGATIVEPVSYSVTFGVQPNPAPVPVPGAVWLLGSGIVGLAARRRKAA